jgi:hypothetical protein
MSTKSYHVVFATVFEFSAPTTTTYYTYSARFEPIVYIDARREEVSGLSFFIILWFPSVKLCFQVT